MSIRLGDVDEAGSLVNDLDVAGLGWFPTAVVHLDCAFPLTQLGIAVLS